MLPTHVYGPPAMSLRCWVVIRGSIRLQIIAVQVILFVFAIAICYLCPWHSFLCMNPTIITMNTVMLQSRIISHVPFLVLFGRYLTVTGTAGRGAAPDTAATPVLEQKEQQKQIEL